MLPNPKRTSEENKRKFHASPLNSYGKKKEEGRMRRGHGFGGIE